MSLNEIYCIVKEQKERVVFTALGLWAVSYLAFHHEGSYYDTCAQQVVSSQAVPVMTASDGARCFEDASFANPHRFTHFSVAEDTR